jgi:hypothetical protein
MEYWMSDVPSLRVIEIINKYKPQIEKNLTDSGISLLSKGDVCIRWAVIFAKTDISGDVRIGTFRVSETSELSHMWICIDEDGKSIIFDPCIGQFALSATERKYTMSKIYEFKNIGSGNPDQDFMMRWEQDRKNK